MALSLPWHWMAAAWQPLAVWLCQNRDVQPMSDGCFGLCAPQHPRPTPASATCNVSTQLGVSSLALVARHSRSRQELRDVGTSWLGLELV